MITIKIMKPLLTLFKTNDSLTPLIVRLTSQHDGNENTVERIVFRNRKKKKIYV